MVGDGQGVAVLPVAELELALEIGAPEVVRREARRQRGAGGAPSGPARNPDEAVAVKDGMDRALGGDTHVARQAPDEKLAELARAPMGLLALEGDDQALDLGRQLVGVAHRPARAVAQGLEAMLLVAIEDLVAGLARDAELATDLAMASPSRSRATNRRRSSMTEHSFQGIRHLPPGMPGGRCYPCVRYVLSPMSRAAHNEMRD